MRIKVNGDYWGVYFLEDETFDSKFGKDNEAINFISYNTNSRGLYFRKGVSKSIIIHELTHLFIAYSGYGRVENSSEEDEEDICIMMEENFEKIYFLANRIFKKRGSK